MGGAGKMTKNRISWAFVSFAVFSVATICLSSQESRAVQRQPNRLNRVVFIPQRDQIVGLAGSEENGTLIVWSIDGSKTQRFDFEKGVWGASIAVSNKGDSVVLGLVGGPDLMCFSLIEKRPVWKVSGIEKGFGLSSAAFTADDSRVVVVGFKTIVTFDSKSGAIVERQEDSEAFSFGLPKYRTRIDRISHTGRYAAFFQGKVEHDEAISGLNNNVWITVYDIENKKLAAKQAYVQKSYKNCSAVFTQDERNLVLGSMDGFVRVWSITDQKVIRQWRAYESTKASTFRQMPFPNHIDSVTLSSDGRLLATIGLSIGEFSIRIWDYATNKQVHEFRDVNPSRLAMCSGYPMAFSPDGKYFAFEQQGKLCLYDTQTWQEKWCVPSLSEGRK
jgi:WD40 repeat protein